uniref:Variant surface glycoprotein 1125.1753 n=1 Tax=Trypanosoma brucei TaxID=5691 RepID=A0A1J0R7S3_9TRYP|nr:variant surface glycoprotein 1125.1753 [Trypanosoma brucei]
MIAVECILQVLVAFLTLYGTTGVHAQQQTDYGPAGDAINSICKEAEFFVTLGASFRDLLVQRQTLLRELQQDKERFELAAKHPSLEASSCSFEALALHTSVMLSKARQQEQRIAVLAATFQEQANRWAAYLFGESEAASRVWEQGPTNKPTVATNTATLPLAFKEKGATACTDEKVASKLKSGKQLSEMTIKKLKLTPPERIAEALGTTTVVMTGCQSNSGACTPGNQVFHGTQNQDGLVVTHGSANDKGFIVTSVKSTGSQYKGSTGISIEDDSPGKTGCRADGDFENKMIPDNKVLAHNLCVLRAALQEPRAGKLIVDGEQLAADDDFLQVANNLLSALWERQDLSKGDSKAKLGEIVKTTFGKNKQAFDSKFRDPANQKQIIYGTGATPEKGTIGQLAGTPAAEAALSYLIGQREKKMLNKASEAKPTVTDEEDSKAKECTTESEKY